MRALVALKAAGIGDDAERAAEHVVFQMRFDGLAQESGDGGASAGAAAHDENAGADIAVALHGAGECCAANAKSEADKRGEPKHGYGERCADRQDQADAGELRRADEAPSTEAHASTSGLKMPERKSIKRSCRMRFAALQHGFYGRCNFRATGGGAAC